MTNEEFENTVKTIVENPIYIMLINYKSGISIVGCFIDFQYENSKYTWAFPVRSVIKAANQWYDNNVYINAIFVEAIVKLNPDEVESLHVLKTFLKGNELINESTILEEDRSAYVAI